MFRYKQVRYKRAPLHRALFSVIPLLILNKIQFQLCLNKAIRFATCRIKWQITVYLHLHFFKPCCNSIRITINASIYNDIVISICLFPTILLTRMKKLFRKYCLTVPSGNYYTFSIIHLRNKIKKSENRICIWRGLNLQPFAWKLSVDTVRPQGTDSRST